MKLGEYFNKRRTVVREATKEQSSLVMLSIFASKLESHAKKLPHNLSYIITNNTEEKLSLIFQTTKEETVVDEERLDSQNYLNEGNVSDLFIYAVNKAQETIDDPSIRYSLCINLPAISVDSKTNSFLLTKK